MPPRPTDAAAVPTALLDEILGTVAALLHDRPVQSLVAARLLIETAAPPDTASDLLVRGLGAITTAAEQSRDIMWALALPEVRPGSLGEDIAAVLDRGSDPRAPTSLSITIDEGVEAGPVQALVRALHLVVVAVRFAGGHLSAVRVESDAEALTAVLEADAGAAQGVWCRLAAARLAEVGGDLREDRSSRDDTSGLRLVLTVPREAPQASPLAPPVPDGGAGRGLAGGGLG